MNEFILKFKTANSYISWYTSMNNFKFQGCHVYLMKILIYDFELLCLGNANMAREK